MIKRFFLYLFLVLHVAPALAQKTKLIDSMQHLSLAARGTVGVAVLDLQTRDALASNGDLRFPMQSVMKFPLALAVLHQVDLGKLKLDQKMHLAKEDLSIPAVSPIRDLYPDGDVDLTIDQLLRYTVSQSDNNGCDKLFALLGGPKSVHALGIKGIQIVATEKEMGKDWQVQYQNWCTPAAMAELLYLFEQGEILTMASKAYLWQLLQATVNAPKRLKGQLPAGAVIGHKPGTSSVNGEGVAAATNDVGIIELPDKRRLAIAVFVKDARADLPAREATIAAIARLAADRFK